MAKREVELRVAVAGVSGRHARLLHAQIVGDELYYGTPFMGLSMRAAYHADGKCHTYYPGGRIDAPDRREPLRTLSGSHLLSSGGVGPLHLLDWTYRVVPDKKDRRRTLVVDLDVFGQPTNVNLWAIEKDRHDLVDEVLARPQFEVIGHVLTEWTQPMLLAFVTHLTQASWDALNAGYMATNPGAATPTVTNPSDGSVGPWTIPKPPPVPKEQRH